MKKMERGQGLFFFFFGLPTVRVGRGGFGFGLFLEDSWTESTGNEVEIYDRPSFCGVVGERKVHRPGDSNGRGERLYTQRLVCLCRAEWNMVPN